MPKMKKGLVWTPQQIAIWNLLDTGLSNGAIAKQVGVSPTIVTKVAIAKKKGFSPDNPYVPPPKPNTPLAIPKEAIKQATGTASEPKALPKATAADSSLLLLKPIPTNCPLTPIMMNARYTAITELKWPADMAWEDFFDTCLVYLFRYWGWGLQGAYKLEDEAKGQAPKPASEKPQGDGHIDQEYLEKATKLGLVMLDILGQGQVAGTTEG